MLSKGIIYILIATASFAIMNAIVKDLDDFHPLQVVFFRAFGTFIFIFPYMVFNKVSIIGKHPKILLLRGIFGVISLATFFIALQRIPLGSAISIRYIGPLFGSVMAYYFLKEKISGLQWFSFLLAFSGVIVLKGFDVRIDLLSLILLLISAFLVGAIFVIIRYLSNKEHPLTIINYFMMMASLVGICFFQSWKMPVGNEWLSFLSIGIFGLIGQVFMTTAFQTENASTLAPFKYMELVYALLMGYFFFGETYSWLPFFGILLIIMGMIGNVLGKVK